MLPPSTPNFNNSTSTKSNQEKDVLSPKELKALIQGEIGAQMEQIQAACTPKT